MNKNKLFILSIVFNVLMIIVALIVGAEAACGGFICAIFFTFEIKNALIPLKNGFGSNPVKGKYTRSGNLKRYRLICIVHYIVMILLGISIVLDKIISIHRSR